MAAGGGAGRTAGAGSGLVDISGTGCSCALELSLKNKKNAGDELLGWPHLRRQVSICQFSTLIANEYVGVENYIFDKLCGIYFEHYFVLNDRFRFDSNVFYSTTLK